MPPFSFALFELFSKFTERLAKFSELVFERGDAVFESFNAVVRRRGIKSPSGRYRRGVDLA